MNHFVIFGFVFLLASLALAVEVYNEMQNVMTLTDGPIH